MSETVAENIRRLKPYVPGKPIEELERELGVTNVIKLASNENPMGPSPRAIEAASSAVAQMNRYPDASTFHLRNRLAEHHGVDAERFCIGNGSNEVIDLVCRTLAAPDEHSVIGIPSFVCYRMCLSAANVPFTEVPLREQLYFNTDDLLVAVKPNTKLLFIANPNNPTGTHLPKDQLVRLLDETPSHVFVVVDEAYIEFADDPTFESALEHLNRRERLIVLRTFSKAYGLAGLRVGYGICSSEVADYLNRVRAPFNANSAAQAAAMAALDDQGHVQEYITLNRTERVRLTRELKAMGLAVAPTQANFVFTKFPLGASAAYDALLRLGVIIRPMPAPVDDWARITVGLADENTRLLEALKEIL